MKRKSMSRVFETQARAGKNLGSVEHWLAIEPGMANLDGRGCEEVTVWTSGIPNAIHVFERKAKSK